ncbi:MAG: bifunctional 3-(3-hydroxy-phenyl)propionate/3-hydroxycinnamic acid hydroxylase [Gammaproteobacteria bacterium]|nr:bifunctional 3-(3-hydroxy-phenyl)propionate/3-hydroxycinnamic acid hydroxylase [Gammaproteobacteria bacterium]
MKREVNLTADVAIVGYGPTGATLANLLAQYGIKVIVIEREAAVYHLPRAVHFDGETMRVFQTVGIADQLSEKVYVNPGMRFVDAGGDLILDWPRPQEIGPQGWYASYRLHQPDLEKLLREKCLGYATVKELSCTEVVSLTEGTDSVTLNCLNLHDQQAMTVKAQYVVGCDGARSLVRDVIGAELDDLGFEERWLVVDVLLKRDRPDLGDHSIQFCNSTRPMTYCRSPANRRRWEITLLEDETDQEMNQDERIWEFLKPWISTEDATIERSAIYTFRSVIAKQWRSSRLMIAGDAAHLTPPFMGQGMCAGIRDAANLAWKLALCVKKQTSTKILDSYQKERSPNVREFIETAIRLGKLINTIDKQSALAQADTSQSRTAKMASIAPTLGSSRLGDLLPEYDSPHQGQLFAQPKLIDGRRLDDVVGYGPVLILREQLPNGIVSTIPSFDADEHPQFLKWLNEIGTNALLIRPDRYIAASATTTVDIAKIAATNWPEFTQLN